MPVSGWLYNSITLMSLWLIKNGSGMGETLNPPALFLQMPRVKRDRGILGIRDKENCGVVGSLLVGFFAIFFF